MKRKAKVKVTKFERVLYFLAILLVLVAPITIVFTKSTLSEINFKVEKMKKNIETQKKTNESIEIASLDNILDVIKKEGLEYNNDSIKNVN